MTFPPGDSLRGLSDIIADMRGHTGTHELTEAELQVAMYEAPSVQGSPWVQRQNRDVLLDALNLFEHEDMADTLAAYFLTRFGKVRTSLIGRDIARIAEEKK